MIGAEAGHRTLGPVAVAMKGVGFGVTSSERAMPEMAALFNAMDAINDDLRDSVRRIESAAERLLGAEPSEDAKCMERPENGSVLGELRNKIEKIRDLELRARHAAERLEQAV